MKKHFLYPNKNSAIEENTSIHNSRTLYIPNTCHAMVIQI